MNSATPGAITALIGIALIGVAVLPKPLRLTWLEKVPTAYLVIAGFASFVFGAYMTSNGSNFGGGGNRMPSNADIVAAANSPEVQAEIRRDLAMS